MLYDHVLPSRIRALGAASDFNPQAWDGFLRGQRDSLQGAWNRAISARARLKKVREALGLPFVVDAPGEPGAPGAWSSGFDKDMLELQAMVQLMTNAADQAVESKRALVFDPASKSFGIELLQTDTLRVALDATGRPVLVDVASGDVVKQFEGSLGLPPLLVGAIVVVVAIAVYAVVEKVCSTTENVAQTKMLETVRTSGAKLIEEGKATPEQVAAMDKALLEGGAALAKAQGEKEEKESQITSTIRTVAWVGLGIAVLYFGATLLSRAGGGAPALARNPSNGMNGHSQKVHLERVHVNADGYDSRGMYFGAEIINGRRVADPVWHAYTSNYQVDRYVRADSRERAKEKVRELLRRHVEFYRSAA